jgi:archaeosortase A (PGF-CTERM-specific)
MEYLDIMLWASLALLAAGVLLSEKYGYKAVASFLAVFGLCWGFEVLKIYLDTHNIVFTIACALVIPITLCFAFLMFKYERTLLSKKIGHIVAAFGWVVFGLSWGLKTPEFYLVEHNIMYTVACALAIPATLYLALLMIRDERESLMVLTKSAAISGIFYFPFAFFPWLGGWLIQVTTDITLVAVNALGQHAVAKGDVITLNGEKVQIILACTAIQSMALFIGVVGCIKAPWERKLKAFLASVPVIYVLNIIRNTFVISAYGGQWFQIAPQTIVEWTGETADYASFFWAHNVLAETGSLIALVAISYAVITFLPETLAYISDIFGLIRPENIRKSLRGEKVVELTPVQRKN